MTATLFTPADQRRALKDLARVRRDHRLQDLHFIDLMYKAYVTAVVVFIAAYFLARVVGDTRFDPQTLRWMHDHGLAAAGVVVAVMLAGALRSGARGGPLGPEAADVSHVLLAPVSRGVVLRGLATRQLRSVCSNGIVAGIAVGLGAGPRFEGSYAAWIGSCALAGLFVAASIWSLAAIMSGHRIGLLLASLIGLVLIGWSVADLALHVTTSPGSALAALAFLPQHASPIAIAAPVFTLIVVAFGFAGLGGVALEAAQRRAKLVGQLRVAATFQDMRTIMLLQRQLAAVPIRRHPYIKLKTANSTHLVGWRRGWRSMLHWPISRVLRQFVLAAVVGASVAAAARGTISMIFVAGIASWFLGNDLIEAYGQEMDHPDIGVGVPTPRGRQLLPLLSAPSAWAIVLAIPAIAAAFAVRPDSDTIVIGLLLIPLAILSAVAGAAITVYLGGNIGSQGSLVPVPELQGMILMARQGGPPLLAILGLAPVAVASALQRYVDSHHTQQAQNLRGSIGTITFVVAVVAIATSVGILYFISTRKDHVE